MGFRFLVTLNIVQIEFPLYFSLHSYYKVGFHAGPDFPSFGPMDGPGPMGFPGRPPPPNGMMMGPNGPGPGMMGPPQAMMGGGPMMGTGARPPHFMGGPAPGPMGGRGPGRPMGMPFRPPFAGRGGRGGPGEQQKRRRGDRGAASKLGNGGSKGRSNQTVSASEQADGGGYFPLDLKSLYGEVGGDFVAVCVCHA